MSKHGGNTACGEICWRYRSEGVVKHLELDPTEVNDFGAEVPIVLDEDDGGGDIFLIDLRGKRNALIFNGDEDEAARSYSSMRFNRSSSEVTDTNASRSSLGN